MSARDDLLAALNAERYSGDWWRRRCIESMEIRERRQPKVPDGWDDEVTTARRRQALADEYDGVTREGVA